MAYVIELDAVNVDINEKTNITGYLMKFRRSWNARVPYTKNKLHAIQFDSKELAEDYLNVCNKQVWNFAHGQIKTKIVETDSKELLTKELREKLPDLGSTDNNKQRMIWTRFYIPNNVWTWYPFELSKQSDMMFGLAIGFDKEIGYWTLSELQDTGLVLRDVSFKPREWSILKEQVGYPYDL